MAWLRKHLAEIILNLTALIIFVLLIFRLTQAYSIPDIVPGEWAFIPRYQSTNLIASPIFRDAGHWAIRFLVISLAMSPLYIYFNWKTALRLRKPAGLWAFAFACLHVWLYAGDMAWGKSWTQTYTRIGLVGFTILAVLAITSHRPAMRLLGKNWKRLHRLVYVGGLLVVLHGLWAASDWQAMENTSLNILEMRIYCVLVVLLVVVRIPFIRSILKRPARKIKHQSDYIAVLD